MNDVGMACWRMVKANFVAFLRLRFRNDGPTDLIDKARIEADCIDSLRQQAGL